MPIRRQLNTERVRNILLYICLLNLQNIWRHWSKLLLFHDTATTTMNRAMQWERISKDILINGHCARRLRTSALFISVYNSSRCATRGFWLLIISLSLQIKHFSLPYVHVILTFIFHNGWCFQPSGGGGGSSYILVYTDVPLE
jgi:hypothetical protein